MSVSPPVYLSQIETPTESHVYSYPTAAWVAEEQMAIAWPAKELGVELDEMDFRVRLTEGERHAVRFFQSLLTKFETFIGGEDLWAYRIPKLFPRPEIQRASAVISAIENDSHAPFYMLANQVMNLDSDEFYEEWKKVPTIADAYYYFKDFLNKHKHDPLATTGALAGLEGVKLFTILGHFKCYNSNGFNFIPHFVNGIDGSAKDENFHSMFSSYLFTICKQERIAAGNHSDADEQRLHDILMEVFTKIIEFEKANTDYIFDYSDSLPEDQRIRVCTRQEMHDLTEDRANKVLQDLGYAPMFNRELGRISLCLYDNLNRIKHSDFFVGTQLQYRRNFAQYKISFKPNALEWMNA